MLELSNETNCVAGLYPGWNENREFQITCVMKRGFSFDQDGVVKPLDPLPEIIEVDKYYNSPDESSVMEVNELSPYKLGGETYLYGTAYPEPNKHAIEVEYNIIFNDGKRWRKKLRISGKRTWNKILLGYVMSKPDILTATPIQYENAYGGRNPENDKECFIFNPVGKGFNKASGWKVMNLELPSIESGPKFLSSPPQQQQPAGYAPIPTIWEPRKRDFGEPHPMPEQQGGCPYNNSSKISLHNVAPLDQRFSMPFIGGEKILLKGFFENNTSRSILEFDIPKMNLDVSLIIDNKKKQLSPIFDTLIINTDNYEFFIIARVGIPWNKLDKRNGCVILSENVKLNQSTSIDNLRKLA